MIINPHAAVLQIAQQPGEQMRLQVQGDRATICQMIANAMYARPDVAAMFAAAAVDYCKKMGMQAGDLTKIAGLG